MNSPDPAAPFWTLDDLAALFGVSRFTLANRRMPQFQRDGFPAALPWCRRERRYNPAAVMGWKRKQEILKRAAQPEFKIVA